MMKRVLIACLSALAFAATTQETVTRVRSWRVEHEKQILRELFEFLAIPNVASNAADIKRNADALMRMFERRRFAPETIPTGGSPLVVAERRIPNVRRTLTFYFHYDGQPVDPSQWTYEAPFTPVIVVTDLPAEVLTGMSRVAHLRAVVVR